MRYLFSICIFYLTYLPSTAQVDFVARLEFEAKFGESNYMTVFNKDGILGFRTVKESGLNPRQIFEMFQTDYNLNTSSLKKLPIKEGHNLIGYDTDENHFYVLFQRGNSIEGKDRYLVDLNLKSDDAKEFNISNILNMDLKEFYVMNGKGIFMGVSESLPVIQIFDMKSGNIITTQGIYSKDTEILQLRKDQELGVFDVLISKRDQYKVKQVSILTFDLEGSKLREVNIGNLYDSKLEIIEGILTPFEEYQQTLIGTFGKQRQEAYQGIYLTEINEFGETVKKYYTLEDFENFYNYLPEKQRAKRIRSLEKSLKKGKIPDIKPVLSTREVITMNDGYLVYSDLFTANNPRYYPIDGMYANSMYRASPNINTMSNGVIGSNQELNYINKQNMINSSLFRDGEYKFHAAQLLLLDKNGNIIWDNSLSLPSRTTTNPSKFGELSLTGDKLHFMYLEEKKLVLSYLYNGEVIFENEKFELKLLDDMERIRETDDNGLILSWWYENNYLLSGKQSIRYQDEEGRAKNREVFFITKVTVNGALFDPDIDQ
ncbi:transcriptional regulator [Belliella aquatica]|uniref:Uncharacterized protein n=1 Tax=Belliella aquatica TaxID=1323734 RepID=A0ABQ1M3C5_9BACT|nr:transcriptional regulator [Belliella aquatica]MCH7404771.1 transcriptional regulator [Belliella aquatica]GGC34261.1 hypothetical protein GCM10010993_11450 [Belliella aquatica]